MLGLPQHVQKELGEHPIEEAVVGSPGPTLRLTPAHVSTGLYVPPWSFQACENEREPPGTPSPPGPRTLYAFPQWMVTRRPGRRAGPGCPCRRWRQRLKPGPGRPCCSAHIDRIYRDDMLFGRSTGARPPLANPAHVLAVPGSDGRGLRSRTP